VDQISSSFVRKDIVAFASNYDRIILMMTGDDETAGKFPQNVKVVSNYINWKNFSPFRLLAKHWLSVLMIYIMECIQKKTYIPFKKAVVSLTSNIFKANEIQKALSELSIPGSENVFYSFWFYDCIYLAWLRRIRYCDAAISRAHGGDLFEDRDSLRNKVLLRNFQLKYISGVYSVSNSGAQWLQKKYPDFANKVNVAYLGSDWHNHISPFDEGHFTIVTCCQVRDIKRLHILAEALLELKFKATWIHIGDENLNSQSEITIPVYKKNKELLLKSNSIDFIPLGELSNDHVFNFYKKTALNLFVSVSETEGLPVSMMEALSFGIPILSTDVGGCKEIVNEKTGVLIPLSTSPSAIAGIITDFRKSKENGADFRKGVREFWEKNFNMSNNYRQFFEKVALI
jgi:glycosyltransferase involved in cell wall biosynthesis